MPNQRGASAEILLLRAYRHFLAWNNNFLDSSLVCVFKLGVRNRVRLQNCSSVGNAEPCEENARFLYGTLVY